MWSRVVALHAMPPLEGDGRTALTHHGPVHWVPPPVELLQCPQVPDERAVRGACVLARHEQWDSRRVGHNADGYRPPRDVGQSDRPDRPKCRASIGA